MKNIAKDISVAIQNAGTYVAVFEGKAYKINPTFYHLIQEMKKNRSLDEILADIGNSQKLSHSDIALIKEHYICFLNKIDNNKVDEKGKYIKFKRTLLNQKSIKKICSCMVCLFRKKIFLLMTIIAAIINGLFFFHTLSVESYSQLSLIPFIISTVLFLFIMLLHEFGHSSACLSLGVPVKDIGFGIYFIFPVLYSDVTEIALLQKRQRLIVDSAGIYFQLLVNAILAFLCFLMKEGSVYNLLLCIWTLNGISLSYALIPFFRNDGYWMYSDYFAIDNLMEQCKKWYSKSLWQKNSPIALFGCSDFLFKIYVSCKLCIYTFGNITDIINAEDVMDYLKSGCFLIICFYGIFLMVRSFTSKISHESL